MVTTRRGGCSWRLVGRGQGRCSTFYSAPEAPMTENGPASNASSAKVEKPRLNENIIHGNTNTMIIVAIY